MHAPLSRSVPLLALALLARTGSALSPAPQDAPAVDPPVLRIDGEPVRRSTYADWLVAVSGELQVPRFVEHWLVRREARRHDLELPHARARELAEAEVEERVQKAFGGDRERWLAELRRENRTVEGWLVERAARIETELALAHLAVLERALAPERMRAEWERRHGPGGRRHDVRLLFRRLVVPTVPGEGPAERRAREERLREELRAEVARLRARALAGEDFAELARAESEDAESAPRGGRLPGGLDASRWPAAERDAILALEPGELSEPIFARGGWWLVRLEGVEVTPFDDVEQEIRAHLLASPPTQAEMRDVAQRLLARADVQLLPCLFGAPEADAPLPPAEPVLAIDGEPVPRSELADWLLRTRGEVDAPLFAERYAVEAAARQEGIATSAAEAAARAAEDEQRSVDFYYDGDRSAWLEDLQRNGRSLDAWRREARQRARVDLLAEELVRRRRTVDEPELRAAWRARYGPDGRSLALRWIRVDVEPPEPAPDVSRADYERAVAEAVARARGAAEGLRERCLAGEDFAALAALHSDDPATRARGGAAPEGFHLDELPEDVAERIHALAPHAVSEPLRIAGSFFLFEVTGERTVSFDSVRELLAEELRSRRPSPTEIAALKIQLVRGQTIETLPAMWR